MKSFEELFEKQIDCASLPESVKRGEVRSIQVEFERRFLEIAVFFSEPIDYETLFRAEKLLESSPLQVGHAVIRPRFPEESFSSDYFPSLAAELKRRDASINGSFQGATARLQEHTFLVSLSHGGHELLLARKLDKALSSLIQEEFGLSLDVKFEGKLSLEPEDAVHIEAIKKEEETRRRESVVEEVQQYESMMNERPSKTQKPRKPKTVSVRTEETLYPSILPETAKDILGRIGKAQPIPIERVTPDIGSTCIWGEIFELESKETRDKSRKIYSISITDYTSSITLKIIQDAKQCKMLDTLKKGMSVLARGQVEYDKYDHEDVMRPRSLATVEQMKVVDDAEEKRVELHLHTNMSSMDGMTPAGDLIKRAFKWGHKAIAITDHGVAQAFPDAMNAVEAIRKDGGRSSTVWSPILSMTWCPPFPEKRKCHWMGSTSFSISRPLVSVPGKTA